MFRMQGNRSSAKLKQCKLDARREQWLSQGLISCLPCGDVRLIFFFFGVVARAFSQVWGLGDAHAEVGISVRIIVKSLTFQRRNPYYLFVYWVWG